MKTDSHLPDAPAQQRRRWTPIKITLLSAGLIAVIAIGSIAWWLASPLFLYNTSNDTNPLAISTPTVATTPTALATSIPNTTPTLVPRGPITLATGAFVGVNDGIHYGTGNVSIGQTDAGKYVLHMEQIDIANGPDLYVYLAPHGKPQVAEQVTNGGANLGRLHATKGSVTIDLHETVGTNLQKYKSVVVYCKAFSVIFTTATLQFT